MKSDAEEHEDLRMPVVQAKFKEFLFGQMPESCNGAYRVPSTFVYLDSLLIGPELEDLCNLL
jgi:hypothetical protein